MVGRKNLDAAVDAKLDDQRREQRLGSLGLTARDHSIEVVCDGLEGWGVRGRGRICGEVLGKRLILIAQGAQAGIKRSDPLLESCGVEVSFLEGFLVAVDGALGPRDLLGERGSLFGERCEVRLAACSGLLDRFPDQASVSVERP